MSEAFDAAWTLLKGYFSSPYLCHGCGKPATRFDSQFIGASEFPLCDNCTLDNVYAAE